MLKKLQNALKRQINLESLSFWKILIPQIILVFAVYGIMLIPRLSTDAYNIYFYTSNDAPGFLGMGRVGTYLLFKVLLTLGVNSVIWSPLFTAVFCLTVAWSAAIVLTQLKAYFPHPNLLTLLLIESAVLLAYANIYFAELFWFSDFALMYVFSILFATLAICLFFHQNRIISTVLSLICLCCSLSFYQATLGMFVIVGSMLVLLKHDALWTRKGKGGAVPLLRDLLCLMAVGGGASLINVLGMNMLNAAGFHSNRPSLSSLAGILESVRKILGQLRYYYSWGYPNYLTGMLKVIFIVSGPMLLFMLSDSFDRNSWDGYPLSSVIITVLTLIADLLVVFAPHLLSENVWVSPRSIFSLFALFSFIGVVLGYNYNRVGKIPPYTALAVMLILFGANVVGIQGIALDQTKVNQRDRQEAETITEYIQDYEAESGQTVDTICWRWDSSYVWTYPEIKYAFMDMNIRAGTRYWSLRNYINYYSGRGLRSKSMTDEIWKDKFQGKSWDSFEPEEQIQFEGSTVYLIVY